MGKLLKQNLAPQARKKGNMITIILLLVIAGMLIGNAIVIVSPYNFYVWSVFGARVRGEKGILREGLRLIWPLISKLEKVSMELVKKDISFEFTTQDNLRVKVAGVFQYRPDPDVMYPVGHKDAGRNVFVTVSEEVILAGVVESVKARIGGIGGNHPYTVFIENRPALGDIINSILRLEQPPHIIHQKDTPAPDPENKESWESPLWRFCGHKDCKFDKPIDASQLIEFYRTHWPQIRIIKENEKVSRSRSEIEKRYGIDVEAFDLGNVDFTPETQEALEKEKQADAKAKAADKRLEVVDKYLARHLSPIDAAHEADKLMDTTITKHIVAIQGEAGVLGGLIAGALGKRGEK